MSTLASKHRCTHLYTNDTNVHELKIGWLDFFCLFVLNYLKRGKHWWYVLSLYWKWLGIDAIQIDTRNFIYSFYSCVIHKNFVHMEIYQGSSRRTVERAEDRGSLRKTSFRELFCIGEWCSSQKSHIIKKKIPLHTLWVIGHGSPKGPPNNIGYSQLLLVALQN